MAQFERDLEDNPTLSIRLGCSKPQASSSPSHRQVKLFFPSQQCQRVCTCNSVKSWFSRGVLAVTSYSVSVSWISSSVTWREGHLPDLSSPPNPFPSMAQSKKEKQILAADSYQSVCKLLQVPKGFRGTKKVLSLQTFWSQSIHNDAAF